MDISKFENATISIREHIAYESDEGGLVVLDLKKNKFYKLNATSAEIFNLIDQKSKVDEILLILEEKYKNFEIKDFYIHLAALEEKGFIYIND